MKRIDDAADNNDDDDDDNCDGGGDDNLQSGDMAMLQQHAHSALKKKNDSAVTGELSNTTPQPWHLLSGPRLASRS